MISNPHRLFIDGDWVLPSSDATIDVITPSTEELFISVAAAQPTDTDRAVRSARRAFDHGPWPRMTHAERAAYLMQIAAQIVSRADELADIWTREVGALRAIGPFVVKSVAEAYEYYASLATDYPFVERHVPKAGGAVGLLVREPVGVVAAIVPWNAPLAAIAYKIAPALLAGCTVIVKAAPEAPGAAYVMAEVAQAVCRKVC